MYTKIYDILLDNNKIGTTEFENSDAPMRVVFGKINFIDIVFGYAFFKSYCLTKGIPIITDYPEDKLIVTADIPTLKILSPKEIEIKGEGSNIEGMDVDVFQVTILGIQYPFFEEEFPPNKNVYNN